MTWAKVVSGKPTPRKHDLPAGVEILVQPSVTRAVVAASDEMVACANSADETEATIAADNAFVPAIGADGSVFYTSQNAMLRGMPGFAPVHYDEMFAARGFGGGGGGSERTGAFVAGANFNSDSGINGGNSIVFAEGGGGSVPSADQHFETIKHTVSATCWSTTAQLAETLLCFSKLPYIAVACPYELDMHALVNLHAFALQLRSSNVHMSAIDAFVLASIRAPTLRPGLWTLFLLPLMLLPSGTLFVHPLMKAGVMA
jgi:hypothetical protein